jgi:hypothetical protein
MVVGVAGDSVLSSRGARSGSTGIGFRAGVRSNFLRARTLPALPDVTRPFRPSGRRIVTWPLIALVALLKVGCGDHLDGGS